MLHHFIRSELGLRDEPGVAGDVSEGAAIRGEENEDLVKQVFQVWRDVGMN